MSRTIDSPYAWARLVASMALAAIGGVGMWSVVVVLPFIQPEFHVDRAAASLPFTLAMLGFGAGGVVMGRLADRVGVMLPLLIGAGSLGLGYILAGSARSLTGFSLVYLFIGLFGTGATYAPLLADTSHWFERRRGIAVALCACGTYIAGTIWPPLIEAVTRAHGWRAAHVAIGLFCLVAMPPLALVLRGRPPVRGAVAPTLRAASRKLDLSPMRLQLLLAVAGLACCVAMATPQVHIVAYCSDLGYGPRAGADMLSLMLGFGIISRIGSGFLADRLGGVATLVIGSAAQLLALLLYFFMNSLASLYVISAIFGLFQGGLVPSYPIIVRENFPSSQAGARVGLVIGATLLGMALGGWLSGELFDLTGGYRAAFAAAAGWNGVNLLIALYLLARSPFISHRRETAPPARSAAE
jgi:MFS family permease